MDLKNKLSEEEYIALREIIDKDCDCCIEEEAECTKCEIEALKQAGIIRKNLNDYCDKGIIS